MPSSMYDASLLEDAEVKTSGQQSFRKVILGVAVTALAMGGLAGYGTRASFSHNRAVVHALGEGNKYNDWLPKHATNQDGPYRSEQACYQDQDMQTMDCDCTEKTDANTGGTNFYSTCSTKSVDSSSFHCPAGFSKVEVSGKVECQSDIEDGATVISDATVKNTPRVWKLSDFDAEGLKSDSCGDCEASSTPTYGAACPAAPLGPYDTKQVISSSATFMGCKTTTETTSWTTSAACALAAERTSTGPVRVSSGHSRTYTRTNYRPLRTYTRTNYRPYPLNLPICPQNVKDRKVTCRVVTPPPTTSPTLAPSEAPTAMPTTSPTLAPSEAPTTMPTTSPTLAPSAAPTTMPTTSPTLAPSEAATSNTSSTDDDTLWYMTVSCTASGTCATADFKTEFKCS